MRAWSKRAALAMVFLAGIELGGCSSGPQVQPEKKLSLKDDGLPVWVDQPCVGLPVGALCSVAESDFAGADVEAAKTDAETVCKNRIADQISTQVGRLTERLSSAMKDLSHGQVVGEKTLKDINQNYQQTTLRGVRYVDYFFFPDRVSPKKLWVRAMVTVDSNKMSREVADAMLSAAAAQRLEMRHEEAQARFDAVRRQYLDEESKKKLP